MHTIIADTAPVFPACPTFGFTSEPNYLVKITAREGGFEKIDRKWARPLHNYTGVPLGDRPEEDIENVLYFWHAMGGMATYFRFKDWLDFKSCRLGANPTAFDMPIVTSGDSPASFRLVKQYAIGSIIQEREITRPIGSTIQVSNEASVVQTDYTLDEATGLLTPGGSFSGTPTSWGGEFDVWVRFNGQFAPSVSSFRVQNATVQLTEKRVKLP